MNSRCLIPFWPTPSRSPIVMLLCGMLLAGTAGAAEGGGRLTGTIYRQGSKEEQVLYTYQRTVTLEGAVTRAVQEYRYPDGKVAARETVRYEGGRMISFQVEDLQTPARGSAVFGEKEGRQRLFFTYQAGEGKKVEEAESVRPDTLVNDSIPAFLQANWADLMKGRTVKSRYIAIERAETVGFEFEKLKETVWKGRPVVVIRMKPSSFIIAALVNPLVFTVEKGGEHRVLTYTGRTTPKLKVDGGWQDLEAVTVFDLD